MSPQRWAVWGGLAALVALAVGLAPAPPPQTVDALAPKPAVRTAVSSGAGAASAPAAVAQVARIVPRVADIDAALPRLWPAPLVEARPVSAPTARSAAPLAAPPPAPQLAPAPAAPPLAYRFVGRYADDARLGVILQGPDGQISLAHAGDALGADYRVESIVGNSMVVRYVPLNLLQTLDIGVTR